ncbi:MAG: GGDEF domain-containing protein [Trueperaceae bacterium]|nr:GGDEF domain-containing protein [Trueperaceae bacterium]
MTTLSHQDRRLIYLYAMPMASLLCLFGETLIQLGIHNNAFDAYGFPFLSIFFGILYFAFLKIRQGFELTELVLLTGLFLYINGSLAYALTYPPAINVAGEIGMNGIWSISIHTMIFWVFGSRKGLRITLIYFFLAILLTLSTYLVSFSQSQGRDDLFYLTQLYCATGLYILIISTFIRNLESRSYEVQEMSDQAFTDALTHLPNRRFLEASLSNQLFKAESANIDFIVAIVDIDHFKSINDTYGHLVGDEVLQQMAQLLANSLRHGDIVGRWGGEEFLIICPNTNLANGEAVIERFRQRVESYIFCNHLHISISCGVSSWSPGEILDNLLKKADKALYKAKKQGRNLVIAA